MPVNRNRSDIATEVTWNDFQGWRRVGARKTVYVVDDDPGMLKGIERLLKAHGFDPELYDSAEAFYDHASPDEALCVVLDVHLGGMSGIDLKRRLADDGTSLPVIFITATDNDMVRRAAHDVGCAAYLQKPFPAKSLVDAIETASALPRGEPN